MPSERPKDIKKSVADHIGTAASALLQTLPSLPGMPNFTGGLARYLDEYWPNQQHRILKNLADTLRSHAEDIDSIQCDLDVLSALVLKTTNESMQTSSEKKRSAFRAILLNFASGKTIEEHKLDLFVQLVGRLTDLQIEILEIAQRGVHDVARERGLIHPGSSGYAVNIPAERIITNASPDLIKVAFSELCNLRLLSPNASNPLQYDMRVDCSFLILSDLGRELLDWIKRD